MICLNQCTFVSSSVVVHCDILPCAILGVRSGLVPCGFPTNILAAFGIPPPRNTCPFRLILFGSVTRVLFELVHRLIELYSMIVVLSLSEIVLALPHVEPVLNKSKYPALYCFQSECPLVHITVHFNIAGNKRLQEDQRCP